MTNSVYQAPMYGCQIGTNCLFCLPNRTNCILLVSLTHELGTCPTRQPIGSHARS
jgi:hypothetical protein